jgi:hypothetical protein
MIKIRGTGYVLLIQKLEMIGDKVYIGYQMSIVMIVQVVSGGDSDDKRKRTDAMMDDVCTD